MATSVRKLPTTLPSLHLQPSLYPQKSTKQHIQKKDAIMAVRAQFENSNEYV